MAEVTYRFRPLGPWAGPATPAASRRQAQFRATYPATLELLWREIAALGGRDVILQVDIAERDIRTDGLPRANARYGSNPGVVVSFRSAHGPLRYATDAYTGWQDNLRAIALSLEALRAVDRYGVSTRGEQYAGWRALPAGNGTGFGSADQALQWMVSYYAADRGWELAEAASLPPAELYRRLAKMLHPDASGPPADWARLGNAKQLLVTAGQL